MSNHVYDLIDTQGDRWFVQPGDPAHSACDALAKQGWNTAPWSIRLPARVLVTGHVRADEYLAAVAQQLAVIELSDPNEPDSELRDLTDVVLLDRFATVRQLQVLLANAQD